MGERVEEIKESFSAAAEGVVSRVSRGFGLFWLLAWFAWNFKILLVIFSSHSVDEKFAHIIKLYPGFDDYIYNFAILPLASAGFAVFLYPIIDWLFNYWWVRWDRLKRESVLRQAGVLLLSRPESIQMRRRIVDIKGKNSDLFNENGLLKRRSLFKDILIGSLRDEDVGDLILKAMPGSRFKSSLGGTSGTVSYLSFFEDGVLSGDFFGAVNFDSWSTFNGKLRLLSDSGVFFDFDVDDFGVFCGPELKEDIFSGFGMKLEFLDFFDFDVGASVK